MEFTFFGAASIWFILAAIMSPWMPTVSSIFMGAGLICAFLGVFSVVGQIMFGGRFDD